MDEQLKTNLAKWNALVPVHARSKMYDCRWLQSRTNLAA